MPTHIKAEVVLQSYNDITGDILTTFKLRYPRIIEAELNTHTLLRGSTSSSRAVPVKRMNDRLREMSYTPEEWGANCAGMSAKESVAEDKIPLLKATWEEQKNRAIVVSDTLSDLDAHKQLANRVTEPYQIIEKVLTGTCWKNFFNLRDSNAAQPEMKELAHAMKIAMEDSPSKVLRPGEWHTPFADEWTGDRSLLISVALNARISYLKDKQFTAEENIELARKLYANRHVKPFEHVAIALPERVMVGSYIGWMPLRKFIPDETNGDDLDVPILNGKEARERFSQYDPRVAILLESSTKI